MPGADVVRHQFSLPRPVSERLVALAPGRDMLRSKIVAEALVAFLDRKGADELELRFMTRLDRMSRQLERIERNGRIELESLGLFVRYMLTVNAPLPDGDEAARAIGRDRFAAFVQRVGQAVASGRSSLAPEDQK